MTLFPYKTIHLWKLECFCGQKGIINNRPYWQFLQFKIMGDKIMQFLTARCDLEIRKLTFYGITRPRSIRKSKQISEQTILSSPQDIEFNPNFAKNCDIRMVKNSVTKARHASVTDRYALNNLLKGRLKASSKLNLSVNLLFSLIAVSSSDTTYCVPGIASHTFMFSFRLAISLKKWYVNRSNKKNRKTKTVYWMNFCTVVYLRMKSSPNNAIWFVKTSFLEAIKYFRISIGAIVLFEL